MRRGQKVGSPGRVTECLAKYKLQSSGPDNWPSLEPRVDLLNWEACSAMDSESRHLPGPHTVTAPGPPDFYVTYELVYE